MSNGTPSVLDGVMVLTLTWEEFYEWIRELRSVRGRRYVYRGHRDAEWLLEPGLARLARQAGKTNDQEFRDAHLDRFYKATLGRRPSIASGPGFDSEIDYEWWALGQHFGLATQLLDWTYSPFVAAYFAFHEPDPPHEQSELRAVWALDKTAVEDKIPDIVENYEGRKRAPYVEFIEPQQDYNPRLISQRGLFSRAPIRKHGPTDIEAWVQHTFLGSSDPILVKFQFTNTPNVRHEILRDLNLMNINPLTLFPDLGGSSMYANLAAEIDGYDV